MLSLTKDHPISQAESCSVVFLHDTFFPMNDNVIVAATMGCSKQTTATFVFLMSIPSETFSAMCAQALQDVIPPFQLNVTRYFAGIILAGALVCWNKTPLRITDVTTGFNIIASSFLGILFNIALYSAASKVPLGTMVTLISVVQIIFVLMIQRLFFHESISIFKLIIVPVIFVGLYLILEPGLVNENLSIENSYINGTTGKGIYVGYSLYTVGIILTILAGITSVLVVTSINHYLNKLPMPLVNMWWSIIGTLVSVLLATYIDDLQFDISVTQALLILGHCCGAALTTGFIISGTQHISLISFAIMDTLRIVLNYIVQFTIMSNIMPVIGNAYEISGMIITMACIIYSICIDIYTEKEKSKW